MAEWMGSGIQTAGVVSHGQGRVPVEMDGELRGAPGAMGHAGQRALPPVPVVDTASAAPSWVKIDA